MSTMRGSSGSRGFTVSVWGKYGKRVKLAVFPKVPTQQRTYSPRWRRTKHYTSMSIHSLATGLHSMANTIDGIHGLMSPVKSYSEGRVNVTTMYRFTVGKGNARGRGSQFHSPTRSPGAFYKIGT